MNNTLETIVKELNPLRDFEDVRFYNHLDSKTLKEKWNAQFKNIYWLLTIPKPLARGGIIGGTLGALATTFNGSSVGEGFSIGCLYGLMIDYHQYVLRGFFKYMKEQFHPSE